MKRSIKAVILGFAALGLLSTLGCVCYSCRANRVLEGEIESAKRDGATGIISGSEPITLPAAGQNACLLVHGWIGSRVDFNDLGSALNDRGFTVRLMLLPGHATTPRALEGISAEEMLEAVRVEYRALRTRYERVDVVGFSMGGTLATLLAAEEAIDRLVLVAPFYEVTHKWFYILTAETWNNIFSPFVPYAIKTESNKKVNRVDARPHIFSYKTFPTEAVTLLCDLGHRAADEALLSRIECPVLLVYSPGDEAASPEAAQRAQGAMKSKKKEAFPCPRSNHHILWDYDGPEAIEAICDFLIVDR